MRRRCSARAATTASRLSRKMSTQIRGFAPAMRVMSRSEPPAAWSGSWPSTLAAPAWLRRTFASACGRWLVTATRRSCAPASIAIGRAPRDVTNPCTARRSSGPVPAVGVRNHVAPANSSAFARSGPRVSAPQIGCPPMKRASPRAAAQTALLVEPTSVTTQSAEARSSTSRTTCGSSATGAATRTRSAPATASASVAAGSTASRSCATRRTSGSGSQPRTVAPAFRAASAADAPMRPVPTTVMARRPLID